MTLYDFKFTFKLTHLISLKSLFEISSGLNLRRVLLNDWSFLEFFKQVLDFARTIFVSQINCNEKKLCYTIISLLAIIISICTNY